MGMKSIRVLAAAVGFAAMSSMAATPAAQVYDVCLSLRTTGAAIATVNNKTNPFLGEDMEQIVYRKPTNVEWRGLIWGCNCEAIDGVWEEVNEILESGYSTIKGCILWDVTSKQPVYVGNGSDFSDLYSALDAGFGWDFINAIGRDGTAVEGAWTMCQNGMACDEDCEIYCLSGSGFGTLNLAGNANWWDCGGNYIESIYGKVSGWMRAPNATTVISPTGCSFCGYEPGSASCEFATAWEWGCFLDSESWMGTFDECRTAVHGTWTVKYNEELSKALCQPIKVTDKGISGFIVSIRDVYNFKSLPLVETTIAAIENTFWQIDPTGCDELGHALALAKQNTYAKEQALDAVSYENLKKAEVWAAAEVEAAANNLDKAVAAYNAMNAIYIASKMDYVAQMEYTTNGAWTVAYINRSQDESTVTGTGLTMFDACIEEFKFFSFTRIEYAHTYPVDYAAAKVFVADQNVKTDTLKAKMEADVAILATAATDVTAARKDYVVAQDALTAAKNDLANITLLQLKAWNELEKAQALEAAAQKAYDDNGCCD